MRLIAFDTECSRDYGTYCEMCSFGYVVSNDRFEIESSRFTLIKASKPTGRLGKIVKVDPEKLASAPEYKDVRRQTGWVFKEDAIYIAHSPENDFRHFCIMDKKCGAEPISCKAFDIYALVKNYANISSYSLADIARTFGIRFDHTEDNYRAKTCIRIIEYLCKEEHVSLERFIEACGKGAVVDSEVIYHRTALSFKQKKFNDCYGKRPSSKGKLSGHTFSMSESFENRQIEIGLRIAEYVIHNGGMLTRKVSESDTFIWDGDISSKRLESANLVQGEMRVISPDELFHM